MRKSFILLAFLFCTSGCSLFTGHKDLIVRTAVNTTNDASMLIESAETTAMLLEKAEQQAAIEMVANSPNPTKEAAEAKVQAIRVKWVPLWQVFDKARVVHKALVDAIKAYDDGTGSDATIIALEGDLATIYADINQLLANGRERVGL